MGDTEVTSGIRQGCTVSPQLFVMVVNIVMNSIVVWGVDWDIKMTISMCQCFFYADDGLLLARSYEQRGRKK